MLGRLTHGEDRVSQRVVAVAAVALLLLLIAIPLELTRAAFESIRAFGLEFIWSRRWDPLGKVFGALPFVCGTLLSSSFALLLSLPLSLGVAIFVSELAPAWLREPLGFVLELLAVVPSVVYGLWGVVVLRPWLRHWLASGFGAVPFLDGDSHGFGMLAAGATLAIMITPTISSMSRDVLRAVPQGLREGALALGATHFETLRVAVLPHVRAGLVGASLLGLGRAWGETIAVAMLAADHSESGASPFVPSGTMASVIASEFTDTSAGLHRSALAHVGLLLFIATLTLNLAARWLVSRVGYRLTRGSA